MTEPDSAPHQRTLSREQVEALYYDDFVEGETLPNRTIQRDSVALHPVTSV